MSQYVDSSLHFLYYIVEKICPRQFIIEIKSRKFYLFADVDFFWP